MQSGPGHRPSRRYSGSRPHQQQQQQRSGQRNQTFDSNGPGVRIRGSAHQVFERYVALAREAAIAGDPIASENLYQHAEHYLRVANAARDANAPAAPRPPDAGTSEPEQPSTDNEASPAGWGEDRPGFI